MTKPRLPPFPPGTKCFAAGCDMLAATCILHTYTNRLALARMGKPVKEYRDA